MLKTEQFEAVRNEAGQVAGRNNAFVVDIALRGDRGSALIQVFVETDKGVTVDECAKISRELVQTLDDKNVISGRYRLEVSSPGLDRPFTSFKQYTRNVGRQLRIVKISNGIQVSGRLQAASDLSIELQTPDGQSLVIPISEIQEAYALPTLK